MPHKKYLHLPTIKKDIAILCVTNFICYLIFSQFDVLETVYSFSRQHELWELDEVIPLGITLTISLLIFSYRRIKELGQTAHTLEQLLLLDPLTNLPNRRSCQLKLLKWCTEAEKNKNTFSAFKIDLDNFKQVNDLYGEEVGDASIILVGQLIQAALPKNAEVFRWLDDNFIIISPNTLATTPYSIAEKLHAKIRGKVMPSTLAITCSVGFTIWQKGMHAENILQQIEDAIMAAKNDGGDQVRSFL